LRIARWRDTLRGERAPTPAAEAVRLYEQRQAGAE
jgi:hypothetical protein